MPLLRRVRVFSPAGKQRKRAAGFSPAALCKNLVLFDPDYKTGAQANATTCHRQFAQALPIVERFITN